MSDWTTSNHQEVTETDEFDDLFDDDEDEYHEIFPCKIVVIGGAAVGKTCIVRRYASDSFQLDTQPTIAVDYVEKLQSVPQYGGAISTQIWDTAGQEKFRAFTSAYYRGAAAAMIVFDLTSRPSFNSVQSWLDELRDNTDNRIAILLVGNKKDLNKNRTISYKEASNYAQSVKIDYIETSALSGDSVTEAFVRLMEQVWPLLKEDAFHNAALGGAAAPSSPLNRRSQINMAGSVRISSVDSNSRSSVASSAPHGSCCS